MNGVVRGYQGLLCTGNILNEPDHTDVVQCMYVQAFIVCFGVRSKYY